MTGRLEGKVAVVSGAGGGKGLALARVLSREGARLVITDIDEEGGKRNVAEVGPDVANFVRLDVTSEEDWRAATEFACDTYGQIDILVNSARIHTRQPDLTATSLQSWREQTAVNLDGAFLGMKHVLPSMRANGAGSIVNVVSLSAVAPFAPAPPYSASHAALLNLTKTTAVNCARAGENIRVNAVVCGMASNSPVDSISEVAKKLIPIGRPAHADDIAHAILFFASDESSYVTGSSVTLDGGYTAESYAGA